MVKFAICHNFPAVRMRRMRKDAFSSAMMRETVLISHSDLIYPVFILEGKIQRERSRHLDAGVDRLSIDLLLLGCGRMHVELGIPVLALFPVIDAFVENASMVSKQPIPNGLVPRAVRELKKRFPELGILTDVALDPYTSHGQDGVIDSQWLRTQR
jgi:porphobilinogen synthase